MSLDTWSCRSPGSGPGLAPVQDAGFLVQRSVPAIGRSYPGSAGVCPVTGTGFRPTGGTCRELEQIDRGIHVPTEHQAARLTAERPLGKRQAWLSPAASRTGLARRIPPIGGDQLPAMPGGLVAEHPPRRAKALICNGPGKSPIGQHASEVKILGRHGLVTAGKVSGCFVQRVSADVHDLSMYHGQALGRLPAVSRATNPTRMHPTGTAQPAQRRC